MTQLSSLTAVSPIDGRYSDKTTSLREYFSEFALIKYRVRVEIEYFIALCELPVNELQGIDKNAFSQLREVYTNFTESDALAIKVIEKVTNHDVKAVEYFIKEAFDRLGLQKYKEFIHFGLTSQDINNTSVPLSIKEAVAYVYLPLLEEITSELKRLSDEFSNVPMLCHTHGQPASPSVLGKEFGVFVYRIQQQIAALKAQKHSGKFGGATGNFNAHNVAYPSTDWVKFGNEFLDKYLGLEREQVTTQISNYDNLASLQDNLKRINTILIDLCRDIWTYISMEYFKQKIKKGEVGSSAMPHKVNPIDFENAEGNLGIANAILDHLSVKLPVSRLQRDLTDSTVLRNIGVPFGHALIAFASLKKGLSKLLLNNVAIERDLENNWSVVAEGIQTILRRESYPNPYEALRDLTRTNKVMNKETIHAFVDTLDVSDAVKAELKNITPYNYTGIDTFHYKA